MSLTLEELKRNQRLFQWAAPDRHGYINLEVRNFREVWMVVIAVKGEDVYLWGNELIRTKCGSTEEAKKVAIKTLQDMMIIRPMDEVW